MLYSSHADYGQKLYHDLFNKQTAEVRKIIMSSPEHTSMVFTELKYFQLLCMHQAPYIPWLNQLARHPESSASQQILHSSTLENLTKVWGTAGLGLHALFNTIRVSHFRSVTDSGSLSSSVMR